MRHDASRCARMHSDAPKGHLTCGYAAIMMGVHSHVLTEVPRMIMTAAPSFPERHATGVTAEDQLKGALERRNWEVTFTAMERCVPPGTLYVLNKIRADLNGPDILAAKGTFAWLLDAKTFMTRAGRTSLPGMERFTISSQAVAAMEAQVRIRRIPGLFAMQGGEDWYFLTPQEVRDRGQASRDGTYWFVGAVDARTMDHIFGDPKLVDSSANNDYPFDWPLEPMYPADAA